MLDAGGSSEVDLDLYRSPKKRVRKAPKSFRMAPQIERGLEALKRMWRIRAASIGDPPEAITDSSVVTRLIESGLDAAFEEVFKAAGLKGLPTTEEQWALFDKALDHRLKKHQ